MDKTCPCGKIFFVKTYLLERTKYCSKVCFYKYHGRRSGLKYVLKKENPTSFKKGFKPWNYGLTIKDDRVRKYTEKGAIAKKGQRCSVATEFKKGSAPFNKGKIHLPDKKHPLWRGDEVGYMALHAWIKRKLGKPNKCDWCETTKSKRFDWHNIDGKYSRKLEDWVRICTKCHYNYHKNWEKRNYVAS